MNTEPQNRADGTEDADQQLAPGPATPVGAASRSLSALVDDILNRSSQKRPPEKRLSPDSRE